MTAALMEGDSASLLEELALSRPAVEALMDLTADFLAAYAAEKGRRGVLDFSDLEHGAVKLLTAYHQENPLREGMKKDEFRNKLIKYEDMSIVDRITDSLVNRKVLKYVNNCVALYDFEVQQDTNQEEIENAFREGGFSPESPDQIAARFPKIKNFKAVIEALINSGKLIRVEEKILLHADYYNKALEMAKEHVAKNGQITLAEMRDLMGASRKFAVAILEYWDKRGITKKVGDARTFK